MPEKIAVLIVEDDENLALALTDNLEQEDYHVVRASTGEKANLYIQDKKFDVIVLDVMLPDTDGYKLCQKWRKQGCDSMIIMLTARSLEDDIVKGFDAGVDDYVVKPYRIQEFLRRIKALLRRSGRESANGNEQQLPGFNIDQDARSITNDKGEEISLTKKEYDLLEYFIQNQNQALTRDMILDEVWGRNIVVDTRTVDNFVSNLKKKLDWNAESAFRFTTIRGVGYRFEIEDFS